MVVDVFFFIGGFLNFRSLLLKFTEGVKNGRSILSTLLGIIINRFARVYPVFLMATVFW
jgi:peptidoglycan/LPS O-acetylase OafA/YrhL